MATINEQQEATVSVQEFHDILAEAGCLYDAKEDSNVIVTKLILQSDSNNPDLKPEDLTALQELATKYSDLISQIRDLDCKFHDITEQYC